MKIFFAQVGFLNQVKAAASDCRNWFFFYVEKCARVHFLGQPVNVFCAHSEDIVSYMECHLVAANPGALLASRLLDLSYPRVRVA